MPDVCGEYAISQTPIVCGPWSVALATGPDARPARLTQLAMPDDVYETDRAAVKAFFERIVSAAVASATPASVLSVLAGGVDGNVLWLAEDAPTGLSLAQAVADSGPIAAENVSGFMHALAAAVEPMHASGMYHGWLSPHNVFSDGASVRVGGWVWGYVMAKAADAGALPSWPDQAYTAPESIQGAAPCARTEVFSAAALAAFAASGKVPAGAMVQPGLPPAVENALRTGMSSDANERYDGVKEMTVDVTVEQAIAMTDVAETNAVPTGGDVPDWANDLLSETLARREAPEPMEEVAAEPQEKEVVYTATPATPPVVVADTVVRVEPAMPARAGSPSRHEPTGGQVFEWNMGEQPGKSWLPVIVGVVSVLFVILGVAITVIRH